MFIVVEYRGQHEKRFTTIERRKKNCLKIVNQFWYMYWHIEESLANASKKLMGEATYRRVYMIHFWAPLIMRYKVKGETGHRNILIITTHYLENHLIDWHQTGHSIHWKIRVRRDSPSPVFCRTGSPSDETRKTEALCHSRCGMIKIPPCSKVLRVVHWPQFCSPSPVMVTSPYIKWNILEWDVINHHKEPLLILRSKYQVSNWRWNTLKLEQWYIRRSVWSLLILNFNTEINCFD